MTRVSRRETPVVTIQLEQRVEPAVGPRRGVIVAQCQRCGARGRFLRAAAGDLARCEGPWGDGPMPCCAPTPWWYQVGSGWTENGDTLREYIQQSGSKLHCTALEHFP